MNGKEITILSGLRENSPTNTTGSSDSEDSTSKVGMYTVIGSALALAVIAGFAVRK